jgi:hypothetical protein
MVTSALRSKKLLFWLVTASLLVVGSALFIELVAIGYLTMHEGHYISATKRFRRLRNTYIVDATRSGLSCRYLDSLFPHPYLAFVHHRNPPCGISSINNVGLWGSDFPSERAMDAYVVLLTGGSVAAQLGQIAGPPAPRFLELALNQKFASPSGKPFRVLNGGDGGWKQPQQTMLFLLYADAVDAVVTLDGFNEYLSLSSGRRFEYPASNFLEVNPLANADFGSIVAKWLTSKLAARIAGNKILERSHAAYLITERLAGWYQAPVTSTRERKTTVESIFALPGDWSQTKREAWAIHQYEKYIRAMNLIAQDREVAIAHFIQPVPAIGKSLTEEEKAVVGDLGYSDSYQRMAERLLLLRQRGVKIYSLLDVFSGESRTLYGDAVHVRREAGGDSPGYRLMAARIADLLGAAWGLRRKQS